MSDTVDLPLAGIRVFDLTTTLAGPYAAQILGDFGADVIKIEAPGGDGIRNAGPGRSTGMSAVHFGLNRNKRSIELDLKTAPAKEALWRLIDGADVFLHAIRPHKIAALGFSPEAVLARNPGIIYAGLHGYHAHGPYGGRPAYDDVVQGEAGIAETFALRDGQPALVPSSFVDKNTGLIAANGILAAIIQRQRTGQGLYLEIGMFEGMVAYNLVEHLYGRTFVPAEGEAGYARAVSAYRRPHATKDGYICMLPYTDSQWLRFWNLAGRAELCDDPRFATMNARSHNIDDLYKIAGGLLTERTSEDWLTVMSEADIPSGRVNSFDDLLTNDHLNAIGFFRPYDHPSEGAIITPDTAYRFNGKSLPVHRHHPKFGEHTREILSEAGYSDDEIDAILKPS